MFFKKDSTETEKNFLVKTCALLIHAAKIDENYSSIEQNIIKKALLKIGANNENIEKIMNDAKKAEENSNQILDFTREVKSTNNENKIIILETLWRIIYSNNEVDDYESNLMRRLAGLLYIDNKIMADINIQLKKTAIILS